MNPTSKSSLVPEQPSADVHPTDYRDRSHHQRQLLQSAPLLVPPWSREIEASDRRPQEQTPPRLLASTSNEGQPGTSKMSSTTLQNNRGVA